MRRSAVLLAAAALALPGCGSDGGDRRAKDADPETLRAQAVYACMPRSERREYDRLAARLRRAVRRVLDRDPDADRDKIHRDRNVEAYEDAMESMLHQHASRVGEECGSA